MSIQALGTSVSSVQNPLPAPAKLFWQWKWTWNIVFKMWTGFHLSSEKNKPKMWNTSPRHFIELPKTHCQKHSSNMCSCAHSWFRRNRSCYRCQHKHCLENCLNCHTLSKYRVHWVFGFNSPEKKGISLSSYPSSGLCSVHGQKHFFFRFGRSKMISFSLQMIALYLLSCWQEYVKIQDLPIDDSAEGG